MCFKIEGAENELDTVKSLMTMTVNSIIADLFDLDFDEINPDKCLFKDYQMTNKQENMLKSSISEYFDDYELHIPKSYTIRQLYEDVVISCFN